MDMNDAHMFNELLKLQTQITLLQEKMKFSLA